MSESVSFMQPLFALSLLDDPLPGATDVEVQMVVSAHPELSVMTELAIANEQVLSIPMENQPEPNPENTLKNAPAFAPRMG